MPFLLSQPPASENTRPFHSLVASDSDSGDDAPVKGVQFARKLPKPSEERRIVVEAIAGTMTALIVMVLNVTYAGVVWHGPKLSQFMSHGIAMNMLSTALSTGWLALKPRQLPFICVADSFMAILFAQGGVHMVGRHVDGPAAFGTLAVSMALTSVLLGAAYVVMGCARVCKVVQFVPSPVMAGYQASIGCGPADMRSSLIVCPRGSLREA